MISDRRCLHAKVSNQGSSFHIASMKWRSILISSSMLRSKAMKKMPSIRQVSREYLDLKWLNWILLTRLKRLELQAFLPWARRIWRTWSPNWCVSAFKTLSGESCRSNDISGKIWALADIPRSDSAIQHGTRRGARKHNQDKPEKIRLKQRQYRGWQHRLVLVHRPEIYQLPRFCRTLGKRGQAHVKNPNGKVWPQKYWELVSV